MPEDHSAAPQEAPPLNDAAAPSNRRFVLGSVMAMMFMIAIEGTIVATAMPTIVGDLGDFDLFSWVFTAYLLTQAVTIPIYGRLADFYGRRRVLFFGMAIFLGASLLCGFAWGMVPLIVFRALQGIGAGALMPVGMTIVADIYAPTERARIQAYVSSVWVIAALIAPLLGAFFVAHWNWATVFWINLPLGAIATAALAWALREVRARHARRIDYWGSALMVSGSGALMFVLVNATKLSLATILEIGGAAILTLTLLIAYEVRIREPMLPIVLWRAPITLGGNLANLVIGAMLMGVTAFLPPYVQGAMGRSAIVAGFMLTAMSGSWPVGSAVAGQVMQRTSYRTSAFAGAALVVAGGVLLAFIAPQRSALYVGFAACLSGFGMGLVNNSFLVAVQSTVDASDRGVATSSIVFMRMVGQTLGTAVFGGIVNAALAGRIAGAGDIVDRMLIPAFRDSLAPAERSALMEALGASLHNVFLIDLALALALLALAALLPRGLSPVRPTLSGKIKR
ncbi:MAG TPA: MDR family MFS transporter [Stellaceae bacterium]|nr:MDR family MFS transporter [Stellaceae bacterium]